jgi:fibronectin type 3 domain-containing protein
MGVLDMTRSWSSRLWVAVGVAAALSVAAPAHAVAPGSEPPTGLHATGATTTSIDLAWDGVPGAGSYQVLRGAADGPLVAVASTTATVLSDTGLTPGGSYVYAVASLRKNGRVSAPSSPVTLMTVPSAPDGLQAFFTTADLVALGWRGNVITTSYDVWRATGSGPLVFLARATAIGPQDPGTEIPAPGYNDRTVSPSTTYTYVVYAVNSAGTSDPSSITVTTPPAT